MDINVYKSLLFCLSLCFTPSSSFLLSSFISPHCLFLSIAYERHFSEEHLVLLPPPQFPEVAVVERQWCLLYYINRSLLCNFLKEHYILLPCYYSSSFYLTLCQSLISLSCALIFCNQYLFFYRFFR